MGSPLWMRVHGGSTHFPIALVITSVVFDLIAFAVQREPYTRDLHAAGFYALIVGALASMAAVLSGLIISGWSVLGSSMLLKHHLFLWPAFGLLVGLAAWRLTVGQQASPRSFAVYLALAVLTAGLLSGAGYWGGEIMMQSAMGGAVGS